MIDAKPTTREEAVAANDATAASEAMLEECFEASTTNAAAASLAILASLATEAAAAESLEPEAAHIAATEAANKAAAFVDSLASIKAVSANKALREASDAAAAAAFTVMLRAFRLSSCPCLDVSMSVDLCCYTFKPATKLLTVSLGQFPWDFPIVSLGLFPWDFPQVSLGLFPWDFPQFPCLLESGNQASQTGECNMAGQPNVDSSFSKMRKAALVLIRMCDDDENSKLRMCDDDENSKLRMCDDDENSKLEMSRGELNLIRLEIQRAEQELHRIQGEISMDSEQLGQIREMTKLAYETLGRIQLETMALERDGVRGEKPKQRRIQYERSNAGPIILRPHQELNEGVRVAMDLCCVPIDIARNLVEGVLSADCWMQATNGGTVNLEILTGWTRFKKDGIEWLNAGEQTMNEVSGKIHKSASNHFGEHVRQRSGMGNPSNRSRFEHYKGWVAEFLPAIPVITN